MRKLCKNLAAAVTIVSGLGGATQASAADMNFSQRILPLDCVFTTINAGSGELYYVTPAACGAVISLPPQASSGQAPPDTNQPVFISRLSPAGAKITSKTGNNQRLYQAWHPLASVNQDNLAQKPVTKAQTNFVAVTGVIIGIVVLLVLAVLAL